MVCGGVVASLLVVVIFVVVFFVVIDGKGSTEDIIVGLGSVVVKTLFSVVVGWGVQPKGEHSQIASEDQSNRSSHDSSGVQFGAQGKVKLVWLAS